MTDRELMQQALDALTYKKWWWVGLGEPKDPKLEAAITFLNKRLAQPEQEPVAWMHTMIDDVVVGHRPADLNRHPERWKPLYTNPLAAECQPLTVEAIRATGGIVHKDGNVFFTNLEQLNQAIEAAHSIKEKNT